jgi:hypothetical protein
MIDAIIYVEKFSELVSYLDANAPETLERDEEGAITMPPNVTAFARTPAVVKGDKLLAYCRFRDEQADTWRGTVGVEVLSEAPFTGDPEETAEIVYAQLFADPSALAKYDSVYDRVKTHIDEETGEETTYNQDKFGVMG